MPYRIDRVHAAMLAAALFLTPDSAAGGQPAEALTAQNLAGGRDRFETVHATADGAFVMGVTRRELRVWSTSDRREVFAFASSNNNRPPAAIASRGDACLLAVLDSPRDQRQPSKMVVRELPGGREVATFQTDTRNSYSVKLAFSPDKTAIVLFDSRGGESTATVFDLAGEAEPRSIQPFNLQFHDCCFVAGKPMLALAGHDADGVTLKLWDYRSDEVLATSRWQKRPVVAVAASSGGDLIAAAAERDASVRLFDLSQGEFRPAGAFSASQQRLGARLMFSNNDARLWNSGRGWLTAWDTDTRERVITENIKTPSIAVPRAGADAWFAWNQSVRRLPTGVLAGSVIRPVWLRKVDPRSKWLELCVATSAGEAVVASSASGPFRYLNPAGGVKATVDQIRGGKVLTWNQRALFLVTRQQRGSVTPPELRRFDWVARQQTPVAKLGEDQEIKALAESPTGRLAIVVRERRTNNRRLMVFGETGQPVHEKELPEGRSIQAIRLSTDGRFAAFSDGSRCTVLDLESDIELASFDGGRVMGFSADSSKLICFGGQALFDLESGAMRWPWPHFPKKAVCLTLPGTRLVTLDGKAIRIWDYQDRELLATLDTGLQEKIGGAATTEDGRRLFTALTDGSVAAWDLSRWTIPSETTRVSQSMLAAQEKPLWPAIPRTFRSPGGVEVIVVAKQAVDPNKVEQALRDALRTVQHENRAGSDAPASQGPKP